jgi:predicted TIM-barrel fold metal-dependent hydrolase
MDEAATELQRAISTLKLTGAIIPSNYFHSVAAIDALAPMLEVANQTGAHLMLHPGQRHDESLAPKTYPDLAMHRASTIDLHAGITHALVSLIHSDAMTRYPHITWQVVNLGGTFPFVVERMDHIVATRAPDGPRPSQLLGGIVFDCASLGPRALEMAVGVFGADHVMFGTDYPIFTSNVSAEAMATARLTEAEHALVSLGTANAILARNAARRAAA